MTAIVTNNLLNQFQQDDIYIFCICIKPQMFKMCLFKNIPTLLKVIYLTEWRWPNEDDRNLWTWPKTDNNERLIDELYQNFK